MTARSLFQIATGVTQKARRTGQPVRRNSYNVGEREARFWTRINPREIGPRMWAAETYNREQKVAGKRNGALGHVGLEVLRELYRIVDYKTGRLEPSINYLQERLRRSRDAVVRALRALREHGFIEWIRRTEPIENPGAGPQIRQVPNAYRFGVPAAVRHHLARIIGKSPQPVDDEQRRADAQAEVEAMKATLSNAEFVGVTIHDPELAAVLTRVGRLLEFSANPPSGQNPAQVE